MEALSGESDVRTSGLRRRSRAQRGLCRIAPGYAASCSPRSGSRGAWTLRNRVRHVPVRAAGHSVAAAEAAVADGVGDVRRRERRAAAAHHAHARAAAAGAAAPTTASGSALATGAPAAAVILLAGPPVRSARAAIAPGSPVAAGGAIPTTAAVPAGDEHILHRHRSRRRRGAVEEDPDARAAR